MGFAFSQQPPRWAPGDAELLPDYTAFQIHSYRCSSLKSNACSIIILPGNVGSRHCTCPLNRFIQAFKIVKLFLKHPSLSVEVTLKLNYRK
jgi:hypothetical protein